MVIYSCAKCGKTFKQKGHYTNHINKKNPCDNIKDKIENIVENKVDELVKEKIQELVEKGEIEIKNVLLENYPDTFSILQKIDNIKKESFDITADEKLYNIMEKKYKLSSVITDVIKESSVDCMQNTRDDINIHQNCLGFDKSLMDENSYFPGIDSKTLNNVDNRQLKATFSYFIKPDTYVV